MTDRKTVAMEHSPKCHSKIRPIVLQLNDNRVSVHNEFINCCDDRNNYSTIQTIATHSIRQIKTIERGRSDDIQ
jgi:flagellar basal body rod protein FlgB